MSQHRDGRVLDLPVEVAPAPQGGWLATCCCCARRRGGRRLSDALRVLSWLQLGCAARVHEAEADEALAALEAAAAAA